MVGTGVGTIGTTEIGTIGTVEIDAKGITEADPKGVVETGAAGVAEEVTVGIIMSAATSSSSKVFVIRRIDIKNQWRLHQEALQIYIKGKKKAMIKSEEKNFERCVPIALASCYSPTSSSESEILSFTMGSSSESSRTSSYPLEDKSASCPRVVELGIKEGVTTKEEMSFIA